MWPFCSYYFFFSWRKGRHVITGSIQEKKQLLFFADNQSLVFAFPSCPVNTVFHSNWLPCPNQDSKGIWAESSCAQWFGCEWNFSHHLILEVESLGKLLSAPSQVSWCHCITPDTRWRSFIDLVLLNFSRAICQTQSWGSKIASKLLLLQVSEQLCDQTVCHLHMGEMVTHLSQWGNNTSSTSPGWPRHWIQPSCLEKWP